MVAARRTHSVRPATLGERYRLNIWKLGPERCILAGVSASDLYCEDLNRPCRAVVVRNARHWLIAAEIVALILERRIQPSSSNGGTMAGKRYEREDRRLLAAARPLHFLSDRRRYRRGAVYFPIPGVVLPAKLRRGVKSWVADRKQPSEGVTSIGSWPAALCPRVPSAVCRGDCRWERQSLRQAASCASDNRGPSSSSLLTSAR